MDKETKKTYILNCKQQAEDALVDRREKWKELWQLYQNKQDDTSKMPWQSRCFIPRVYMTIEQASSVVKRAVMSSKSLYSMESKDAAQYPDELIAELDAKFRDDLDDSNFADVYGEQIKPAFLLGAGATKILWDKGFAFEHVEIENLYIDPHYKPSQYKPPKFVIERKEMDLAEFKRMALAINKKAGKSLYNTTVLDQLEADFNDQQLKIDEQVRKGLSNFFEVNRRVEIIEYWGDVVDDETGEIEEARLVVMVNDMVIRDQQNPFKHKLPPYILTIPIIYPHRGVAGVSLVEPIATLQYTLNNATNMLLDNMNFTTNKSYEVNVTSVMNPQSLTQIYPGKLIKKNTSNPVIQEVKTTSVGQEAFSAVEMLHKFIEKGTAVTEFIEGSAGKTKTLGETQIKTAQAQGWFDTIARDLEKTSLTPLIRMAFSVWSQYKEGMKYSQELIDAIRIRVGGLTIMLRQQEQSQNLMQAIGLTMKSPELNTITDTRFLWKKLLSVWGLSEGYSEKPQSPTMEQRVNVDQMAAANAKQAVQQMSPEQKQQIMQRLGGQQSL